MMQFSKKIHEILAALPSIDIGYGGFTFFASEELEKAQVGYSIDSRKNSILKGTEGEWQKEWIVIGLDDLVGDPIFVDTKTTDLVVMTAEHAAEWNPYPIADSLDNFVEIINQLATLSFGRNTPETFEENPLPEKDKNEFISALRLANPNSEIEYWEGFFDLE